MALPVAPVQLDPHREEDVVGRGQGLVVVVEEDAPGRLRPAQGVDVAQAAPPVLEVGLEEEGDLPRLGVAGVDPVAQRAQPAGRTWPARRPPPAPGGRRRWPASPAMRRVSRRDVAVSRSSWASATASFTDRTPWPSFSPASHSGYQICSASSLTSARSRSLRVWIEEDVEVAARAQVAPAVAPDRHQGHARRRPARAGRPARSRPARCRPGRSRRPAERDPPGARRAPGGCPCVTIEPRARA